MSDAADIKAPAVPVWNCEFAELKTPGGSPLDALTVGAKFSWKCHGDIAVAWDTAKPVTLAFPKEEDAYTLYILRTVRQDPNDVQFDVTAYKAGDHKPEFVRVLQGDKGFEADKPEWKVRSVLDPKQQQQQPFGPLGPWQLSLPLWFVAAIVIAVLLVAYMIFRRVRRHTQRRRMLEELARHKTALLPLHQFYRDARQLRRRIFAVKEPAERKDISRDLDREFRLYVLRQFQIPALDWSNQDILRDLRKRHRKIYLRANEPLRRTLRELMKLKDRAQVSTADLEQMHRASLETAEQLDRARELGGRR